jgi:hypothetical protein
MRERVTAFGRQLVELHEGLRDRFEELRDELAAGGTPSPTLAEHCAAFCSTVARHHVAEDAETFPAVAARHPELRDVVETLARDHVQVAELLRGVAAVVAGADRERALLELDGLGALLESHFTYEERKLAAVLDTLDAGPRE